VLWCGVAVTARVYDWVVAFCWSFGIGRDLSTATSWAPTEQWPGERHLCFPSYREYKTRQRALWIAERLQSIVGPDYMNRVWRFKVWLSRTRLPLTAPRALGGATELQSEKECLVCLAPPAVREPLWWHTYVSVRVAAASRAALLLSISAHRVARCGMRQDLVRDPCGHASLCPKCRHSWLQRTPCCPICRERIPYVHSPRAVRAAGGGGIISGDPAPDILLDADAVAEPTLEPPVAQLQHV